MAVDIDKVVADNTAWLADKMIFNRSVDIERRFADLLAALEQSRKEVIEHQLELLAKDTDILLLEKRVAELEARDPDMQLMKDFKRYVAEAELVAEKTFPPVHECKRVIADLLTALEQSQKRVAELEKQLYFASLPNAELEPERWDNEQEGR